MQPNHLTSRIQTRYGEMMYHINDDTIGKHLQLYGEWAQTELEFMKEYIQPGDVCVDAGAHIGFHTLFFAQQVGSSGSVLSFEPQKILFELLCENIRINHCDHVHPYDYVLSNENKTLYPPLVNYTQMGNFGAYSMQYKSPCLQYESTHRISLMNSLNKISAIQLDSLKLQTLNFMKIDVEGLEFEVLHGAIDTIRRCKPLMYIEYYPERHTKPLIPFLNSLGYKTYIHKARLFNPCNFRKYATDISNGYVENNLFCIHE